MKIKSLIMILSTSILAYACGGGSNSINNVSAASVDIVPSVIAAVITTR